MNRHLRNLGLTCFALLAATNVALADSLLAAWDFKSNCAGLGSKADGGELTAATIKSDNDAVVMSVEYNDGKIKNNDNSYQVTKDVELRVPVQSTNDFVLVVGYSGYSSYSYGADADAQENTTYHSATSDEVEQGYVSIVSQSDNNYYNYIAVFQQDDVKLNEDREVLWDFQNGNPSDLAEFSTIQGKLASLPSTESGVSLYVDTYTNSGKLSDNGNNAQFNAGTILRVPVLSTKDVLTIVAYNDSYAQFTVGDIAAESATTEYKVTATDVRQGFVEIVATAQSYLFSIKVEQKSVYEEKSIYSTDFSEWDNLTSAEEETEIEKSTKYSGETLTFTFYNTGVNTGTYDTSKFPNNNGYRIFCDKNAEGYITTSKLASITKVRFVHGATGGSRGYKLEAKGDGDEDWVTISDSYANPSGWCEVTADVNKENCQLRFTNLTKSQYAYILELEIFGMVDMSQTPTLGTFKANGTEYTAVDIFDQNSDGDMVATIEVSKSETMISEENPLTDITTENGTLGTVAYESTETTSTVTIPVTANGETLNYVLIVVQKPDYTLTYYNTDGTEMGTQTVEKDATIGTFEVDYATATAQDGYKVRGWFYKATGGQKYTTADVITGNISLYAVETEIEVSSDSKTYTFSLGTPYFYAEDHEAFSPTSESKCKYHDNTHGWSFYNGDVVEVLVGAKATISVALCKYGKGTSIVVKKGDEELATLDGISETDGSVVSYNYEGEAGTLTLNFESTGEMYIHSVKIVNTTTTNYLSSGNWYVVNADDASSLIDVINAVNGKNGSTSAERSYIFLPNGTYDLGTTCLTNISGHNISLIGESMDGVVIKNTPEAEGISVTATLLNTGTNLYIQDVTLKNEWDYYGISGDGRAVCLQDKGSKTICKNVSLLSYQDTYYTNNASGQYYWETSDIHGTVDFICGEGTLFVENSTITVEQRNSTGKGECTITAPSTSESSNYGYVFSNCTIDNYAEKYNYGRAWNNAPRCAYINTIVSDDKIIDNRWTLAGMNSNPATAFVEYNTVDADGTVVSPESHIVTFTANKSDATNPDFETILTSTEAANYTVDKVFTDWAPAELAKQVDAPTVSIDGNTASWTAVDGAIAYLVFVDGELLSITTDTEADLTTSTLKAASFTNNNVVVRAANAMGGLSATETTETTPVISIVANNAEVVGVEYYSILGQKLQAPSRGVCIVRTIFSDGSSKSTKLIVK